jgi:hypothetical protein
LSIWIVFGLFVVFSSDAQAVIGYDSQYVGESAFIDLLPGQTGTFTVFFANIGSTAWAQGTATQVKLAACRDDKVTCNVVPEEAAFNDGTWYSPTAYATQTQVRVEPNTIGTFFYRVKAPTSMTQATLARFNGDLALVSTGQMLHQEGYYQDANVKGSSAGGGGSGTGATVACTGADSCDSVAGVATNIIYAARDFLRAISGLMGMRT